MSTYKGPTSSILSQETTSVDQMRKATKDIEEFWSTEILRGERVRINLEPRWRRARKNFRAKYWLKRRGKDFVERPLFYANVMIQLSNVVANKPEFSVRASRNVMGSIETMVQNMLDYETKRLRLHKTVTAQVQDVLLYNIGIVKVAYNFDETYNLAPDSAYFKRISPFQFVLDPECTDMYDARWVAEIKYLDWEKVVKATIKRDGKEHPKYFNLKEAEKLKGEYVTNMEVNKDYYDDEANTASMTGRNVTTNSNTSSGATNVVPSKIEKIKVYEIYDRVERKMMIMAGDQTGGPKTIIFQMDYPEYVEAFPYFWFTKNVVPDFAYGITDFELNQTTIYEANKIGNRFLEYTKRAIPKYVVNKAKISNKDKFEDMLSSDVCGCIVVDNPNGTAQDVVWPLPLAPFAAENGQTLQIILDQYNKDTGVNDYQRGEQPKGKTTATEASIISASSSGRAGFFQRQIEENVEEILKALFRVIKHTTTGPKWISVSGTYPVKYVDDSRKPLFGAGQQLVKSNGFFLTPDVIEENFTISISAGSMAAQETAMMKQLAMNNYNTFLPNPLIDKAALTKYTMKKQGMEPDDFITQQQATPPGIVNPTTGPSGLAAPPNQTGAGGLGFNPNEGKQAGAMERGISRQLNPTLQ
jgi:hypothetical protein